jgi:hypothetical protein
MGCPRSPTDFVKDQETEKWPSFNKRAVEPWIDRSVLREEVGGVQVAFLDFSVYKVKCFQLLVY